eukprot:541601_1
MRTFSGKRSTLALAIAGVTAMSGFMAMPEARAEGFIDDSTLTGGIYYWQRERDRKDVTDGDKYKTNLSHSTWNATGGGFLTASKQFRHGATSKSRSNTAS